MILEFKTPTNINGKTEALRIDTDAKTFTRNVMPYGVRITRRDYRELIHILKEEGYAEL